MAGGDRGEGRDPRRWRHKNLCPGNVILLSTENERKNQEGSDWGNRFQSPNEMITSSGKYWEVGGVQNNIFNEYVLHCD